ncbi:MAG: antibiotic biosynthesis monooxygenase family protein [Nitriliruptor sp.]
MYVAKRTGRDRWCWAEDDAYGPDPRRDAPAASAGPSTTSPFVAYSALRVPEDGRQELIDAFGDRLRAVEGWQGFHRLEVWEDPADATSFVMVSWWDDEASFRSYMASEDHRRSHARIPTGDLRPRPDSFSGFRVVAR